MKNALYTTPRIHIRPLTLADTDAVLGFERDNREWFERWVPARAKAYFAFESLQKINGDLVAEALGGTAYMHLIFDINARVIGRINLTDIMRKATPSGELGYRIAQDMAGQGVATQAIGIIENMAYTTYGLEQLRASCLESNPASFAVLQRSGFVENPEAKRDFEWQGRPDIMRQFTKNLP
ncbi:MAG: GNAT family protein [Paracoccaceae bacterium]